MAQVSQGCLLGQPQRGQQRPQQVQPQTLQGFQLPSGPLVAGPQPNGFYPKHLTIRPPQVRLIPRNFADQYAVQDFQPTIPQSFAVKSNEWTLNLQDYDNSNISNAFPYQSAFRSPSWCETWWRPGAVEGPLQGMNENLRTARNL